MKKIILSAVLVLAAQHSMAAGSTEVECKQKSEAAAAIKLSARSLKPNDGVIKYELKLNKTTATEQKNINLVAFDWSVTTIDSDAMIQELVSSAQFLVKYQLEKNGNCNIVEVTDESNE